MTMRCGTSRPVVCAAGRGAQTRAECCNAQRDDTAHDPAHHISGDSWSVLLDELRGPGGELGAHPGPCGLEPRDFLPESRPHTI
jgi:hypothetical protein